MKNRYKVSVVMLALVLCMVVPMTVFASSASSPVDTYLALSGSSSQSGTKVATTTTVTRNPDNAYLRTEIEFKNGVTSIGADAQQSARGVKTLSADFHIYFALGVEPNKAYCAHNVQGGTQSPVGYAVYTSVGISIT